MSAIYVHRYSFQNDMEPLREKKMTNFVPDDFSIMIQVHVDVFVTRETHRFLTFGPTRAL